MQTQRRDNPKTISQGDTVTGDAATDIAEILASLGFADSSEQPADSYCRWSATLYSEGRTGDAERILRLALECDIDSPGLRNNLSVILWTQGRASEARDQAEIALRLDPGFADAQMNLNSMRMRMPKAA